MEYECDSCHTIFSDPDIEKKWPDIPNLAGRLTPGGIIPFGECPDCKGLLFPTKQPGLSLNENVLSNIQCPDCGDQEQFKIRATAEFEVTDDGTGDYQGVEWNDSDVCKCQKCGHRGVVSDFKLKEYRVTWRHELSLLAHSDNIARQTWEGIDLDDLEKAQEDGLVVEYGSIEEVSFECVCDDYRPVDR